MTCEFLTHLDVLHVLPALSVAEVECGARCADGLLGVEIGWLFWSLVIFQDCADCQGGPR